MEEKIINIKYKEYDSAQMLPTEYRQLVDRALKATANSYAPYSGFHVGAAVKMSGGETVTGSNQENAAYPSGLCAERVALFHAHHTFPNEAVKAIAVIARDNNGNITEELTIPCAACIQVLVESQKRANSPIAIIIGSATKVIVVDSVENLLPFSFGK